MELESAPSAVLLKAGESPLAFESTFIFSDLLEFVEENKRPLLNEVRPDNTFELFAGQHEAVVVGFFTKHDQPKVHHVYSTMEM